MRALLVIRTDSLANGNVQKRKRGEAPTKHQGEQKNDTAKPSAVFAPSKGRRHTFSVALPGSIIAKYVQRLTNTALSDLISALTHDQKTALAGQIARACAVFCVDEVVIFDDGQAEARPAEQDGYTAFADPNFFLYHLLSYLETPPHLRKRLFPMHSDLRTAGSLPSLDMPHHLRSDEDCPYREGIITQTEVNRGEIHGVKADCGLPRLIFVPLDLEENTRVTIKLDIPREDDEQTVEGQAVSPDAPREEAGYYWGYSVRQASSLSNVFTECPFDGGYDVSIGTSERGSAVSPLLDRESDSWVEPIWNHLLVVFGGLAGLEAALTADQGLKTAGVKKVETVFDHWVNLVPGQGSRTVRTEEAVWIGLTALRPLIATRNES